MTSDYVTTAEDGRGCGTRSKGSPYLCSGLSLHGQPVEDFILDPPVPLTVVAVSRSLYSIIKVAGVNHVLITVGAEHYPSIWSFIEEIKWFGASRKIPNNFPFEKLTPGVSSMFFAHSHVLPEEYTNHEDMVCGREKELDNNYTNHVDGSPCTFATRSYAPFLHTNTEMSDTGIRIPFENFHLETPVPKSISHKGNTYEFETNKSEFVKVNKKTVRTTSITFNKLASDPYLFLTLPITHVEGREFLPPHTQEKAHTAGYETFILDY